ncbi:hypothetical protein [Actinacidiphila acididurans]|nr:hypothetical protein [Actinacidiphila acididurans]
MTAATREPLPGGALVLAVPAGRPGPPGLRFEDATSRTPADPGPV